MAFPFGGHPTLGQYMAWAKLAGCRIDQGVTLTPDGKPYSLTRIISPDGKRWVFEVGTQHSDFLVPTTIARLDRRLGMKSPFFGIDPETGETSGDPPWDAAPQTGEG